MSLINTKKDVKLIKSGTGREGENMREGKWVRDIKEGSDKEKKGTEKKVEGEGVKEAKVRGPHSCLGART